MKSLLGRTLLLYVVRILRRSEFKIVDEEKKGPLKRKKLSNLAGIVSLGGDSIKDSEVSYE
ncbi:MAG: hypothetical protein HW396_610 [Candidatus Dadabacteria bacterium]|jgi:hypothetical protein|nr:hypothetical protein [Candidatus Dadabacteria bacterium]